MSSRQMGVICVDNRLVVCYFSSMIEWIKEGRRILAQRRDLSDIERTVMAARIEDVASEADRLQFAQSTRGFLGETIGEFIQKDILFRALYPEYANGKFSDDLQTTLAIDSLGESKRLRHHYVGTEHLLLGLLHAKNPVEPIFQSFSVDTERVRSAVERIITPHVEKSSIAPDFIGLTSRAKKAVDFAIDEAKRLKHPEVTNQHLLLGLIREEEGIAAGVLGYFRLNLQDTRQAVCAAQIEE